jgi:hypothetical protein
METSRVSARQPRFFLLLVQKKEPKEKDTPHHVPSGFLALLDKAGGCATRPNRTQKTRPVAELKQCSPRTPALPALLSMASGERNSPQRHHPQPSPQLN